MTNSFLDSLKRRSYSHAAVAAVLLFSGCATSLVSERLEDQNAAIKPADLSDFQIGKDLLFNAATKHDYPKAILSLEEAYEANPNNAEIQIALIYAYSKKSKYDEAQSLVASATALKGQLSEQDQLWLDALTAKVNRDPKLESEMWEKAVSAFPNDRWAWYELSTSYTVIDEYQSAADACVRALEIEPNPSKWEASYLYFVHSKALLRLGDAKGAIKAAEAGRTEPLASNWNLARFNLYVAKTVAGDITDYDQLETDYLAAMHRDGTHSDFLITIDTGFFFFEIGDYERAIKFMKQVHDPKPLSITYAIMAYSLTELGREEEALNLLEEARTAFPGDPDILTANAWTLYRIGDLEAAIDRSSAALAVAPKTKNHVPRIHAIIQDAIRDPDMPQVKFKPWVYF